MVFGMEIRLDSTTGIIPFFSIHISLLHTIERYVYAFFLSFFCISFTGLGEQHAKKEISRLALDFTKQQPIKFIPPSLARARTK